MSDKCPLCSNELVAPVGEDFSTSARRVSCPNCGQFQLTFESWTNVTEGAIGDRRSLALLSHRVRLMQRAEQQWPELSLELIDSILRTSSLPSPPEQATNLLLWLGDMGDFGKLVQLNPSLHSAIMGAVDQDSFVAIVLALAERNLLRGDLISGGSFVGRLTFDGWQAYADAKRGSTGSRLAFMAMEYGNQTLERVFRECFSPAVDATGFRLTRLDVAPPAGLIDDRLRVEIRKSRFLIADLSTENRGAYWEAGFAEGLGKPVIYTCEAGHFETEKSHFDTNHHLTVCWGEDALQQAAEALKTTIRATLPAEALMES